jgi:transposase
MAKTRPPYTPEFRRQMVELVRVGRSPEELAREFEPTAQSIKNWVGQAERDAGGGDGGLTIRSKAPGRGRPREETRQTQRSAARSLGRYLERSYALVRSRTPCRRDLRQRRRSRRT